MEQYFGSAGTLIAAALETLGYYYQAYILDALGSPLRNEIGTLIYIAVVVIAVGTIAIGGRYKLGAWLFVGPSLFIAAVFQRTDTAGVRWNFAGEQRSQVAVTSQVKHVRDQWWDAGPGDFPQTARVSSLFAYYNNLVSDGIQQINSILRGSRKDLDAKFLIRNELLYGMKSSVIESPGLKELVQVSFLGECRQVVELGRQLRDVRKSADERKSLRKEFESLYGRKTVQFSNRTAEFIAASTAILPGRLSNINSSLLWGANDSTEEIEAWLEKVKEIEISRKSVTAESLEGKTFEEVVMQLKRTPEEEARYQRVRSLLTEQSWTCGEAWKFTYGYLWVFAKRAFDDMLVTAESRGIKPGEMVRDLRLAVGFDEPKLKPGEIIGDQDTDGITYEEQVAEDPSTITDDYEIWKNDQRAQALDELYRLIAKYILRNEIQQSGISNYLSVYAKRGPAMTGGGMPGEGDLAYNERTRQDTLEWESKTKMFNTASQLPYYQGLAAFFLSILYPFFGLLLLIPGKESGFLMWFLLWLWVKSWDIGFTLVMIVDELFFTLLSRDWTRGGKMPSVLDADVVTTLSALQESDPSMQMTTWYTIAATILEATTVILSLVTIGLARGGAGLIAEGIKKQSGAFAIRAGLTQGQELITGARLEAQTGQANRASNYLFANEYGWNKFRGYRDPRTQVDSMQSGVNRSENYEGMTGAEQRRTALWQGAIGGFLEGFGGESAVGGGEWDGKERMGKKMADSPAGGGRQEVGSSRAAKLAGLQGVAKAASGIPQAYSKAEQSYYKADVSKAVSWARYDEINDSRAQFLAGKARIGYMFEIPWTESTGHDAEFEYHLNLLEQSVNKDMSYVDAVNGVVKTGLDYRQRTKK